MHRPVWFWQRTISPHMASLVTQLAALGRDVTYVAERELSPGRAAQGWQRPHLDGVSLRFALDRASVEALVDSSPADSIHVCQGIRGNGLVGVAQNLLARKGLTHWIVMETIEEHGVVKSLAKRIEYARLARKWNGKLNGILAIGYKTKEWLSHRGFDSELIYPFAYFLREPSQSVVNGNSKAAGAFKFLFVGRFIELKRLDLLIRSLEKIKYDHNFELIVVGSGGLEGGLHDMADRYLSGRCRWLGRLASDKVGQVMAASDCLVLPSRNDGWGAVVSEAMMLGTPAICSDRCGAAGVVEASGRGGVFPAHDKASLTGLLRKEIDQGRQTQQQRISLAHWAKCLGAGSGAAYLNEILESKSSGHKPSPPWHF